MSYIASSSPAGGTLGADVCIAFPGPDSKGTWDCIKKAAKAGIVTHIYPLAVTDA